MHICRLIVALVLLLSVGCERQLATAPDQVPASGAKQLALDTPQVRRVPGFCTRRDTTIRPSN